MFAVAKTLAVFIFVSCILYLTDEFNFLVPEECTLISLLVSMLVPSISVFLCLNYIYFALNS